MTDVDLFPDEAEFTARPAWMVIEAARRQYLSGRLSLDTSPPSLVYLRDGFVYFAERSTDGALSVRLLVEGVISREQMQRGTLVVNGIEHLGRMFHRDPGIDRDTAELCVEMFRDEVLASVAEEPVSAYRMEMYRHHPSGIDRWFPAVVNVAVTNIEGGTPIRARHPQPVPAVTRSVPVVPVTGRPRIMDEINATREVPTIRGFAYPTGADAAHAAEPGFGPAHVAEPPVPAVPADATFAAADAPAAPAPAGRVMAAEAPAVTEEVPVPAPVTDDPMEGFDAMSSAIADEVAEAVRRALAAIDAAAQPMAEMTPADFGAGAVEDAVATGSVVVS